MTEPFGGFRGWRIGQRSYDLFSPEGARIVGGRWNSPGVPVLYLASSLEGAMLEIRVHTEGRPPPARHASIWVDVPGDVTTETFRRSSFRRWRTDLAATREFGDRWVAEGRSLVLIVPSVVIPAPYVNFILNPMHPEFARVRRSARPRPIRWDPRLF